MASADEIRAWIIKRLVEPARRDGLDVIDIRAGEVHDRIGLRQRVPAVCSVLGGQKFAAQADVQLLPPVPSGPRPSNVYRFHLTSEVSRSAPPPPVQTVGPLHKVPDRDVAAATDLNGLSSALVLVSCVKSKRSVPAKARDLYTSDFFLKARRIAERAQSWRILSAKHGLLDPDSIIPPYEQTLNAMPIEARRRWAAQVIADVEPLIPDSRQVIILASARYREFLVPALVGMNMSIAVPMQGLRQGEQLAWLGQNR